MAFMLKNNITTMKKILSIFLITAGLLFSSVVANAQTINMPGGTQNTCTGTFQDPGGAGNYGNNLNVTMTLCSNTGQSIYLQFTSFTVENGFDNLSIYNGPNTGSPLIGTYTGSTGPGTVVSSGTCLTFVFTTDGSVTPAGWAATIGCGTPPPPPPPPPPAAPTCALANPFCTGTTYTFPASTGTTAQVGPSYGCLFSQPNPAWYFMQIQNPGNLTIGMSSSTGVDIDFVAWGPFASQAAACANLTGTCSGPGTNPLSSNLSCSF